MTVTLPLSPGQRGLWFLHELFPGNTAYNTCTAIELRGPVNPAALRTAVAGVLMAHENLRAVVTEDDSGPGLVFRDESPGLHLVDLRGLSASAVEEQLRSGLARLTTIPFDLRCGPLARWMLIRCGRLRHVLVLDVHHLVFDADSLGVVCRELEARYSAALTGSPATVAPSGGEARFALEAWAAEPGYVGRIERGLRFWRERLETAPRNAAVPAESPALSGAETARATLAVGHEELRTLSELCRQENATVFAAVLALTAVVLARHTAEGEAVIGSPVSLRSDAAHAEVVGLLINTLPLRVRVAPRATFRDVLREARDMLLDALEHRDVPLHQIVEALARSGELGFGLEPVFDTLLTLRRPVPPPRLAGVQCAVRPIPASRAKYSLTVTATPTPDGLEFLLESEGGPNGPWQPASLAAQFRALIQGVSHDTGRPVHDVPLADAAELADVERLARGPVMPRPADTSVRALFTAAVLRHPDGVAVAGAEDCGGRTHVSYRMLRRVALCLAARLRASGARADDPVAVLCRRGTGTPAAYLGVLFAGAAILPLDPEDPDKRLKALVAHGGVSLAVTERALADRCARLGLCPTVLEDFLVSDDAALKDPPRIHPDQAAYIICTSGSTGEPKGVVISHRAVANRLQWLAEAVPLYPGESVLVKTPVGFDVSMAEILGPLTVGATLVPVRPGTERDPQRLLDLLAREQIEQIHFVPSMLAPFLAEFEAGRTPLPALRTVLCSGEALSTELSHRALRLLGVGVHNLYGPTEAAIDVTRWPCEPPGGRPVVLGSPGANIECRVLDERLRVVPRTAIGELYLAGICLARGYRGRPGLTAASFRPAPGQVPGGRMYRTGDFARWNAAGSLEYLGRRDQQVKIGGRRVEPAEVAEVLRRRPGVVDAAVLPRDGGLAAFVVLAPGHEEAAEGLLEALRARLPGHLVPHWIRVLPELPSNGTKTDLRALRAMPAPIASSPAGVAPRTGLERRIAAVWGELLGLPMVGVTDRFFELGGTSLTLLGLHRRLVDAVAPDLAVRDLFRFPTVAALARHLEQATAEDASQQEQVGQFAQILSRADRRRAAAEYARAAQRGAGRG